jgi:fructose-1,6-bisphosphatase/inositol monophosphatase family enzyme
MLFTIDNALRLGEILSRAARTEIMPRFGGLTAKEVREKSSRFDVVTDADDAAELAISAALAAAYPESVVIGEEATARDPRLLDVIGVADFAFVLDPLDGTKNFASGLPLFGVMAAATVRGEVVLAAIHDPVCRNTAFALRGEGAWTQSEDGSRTDLKVAGAVDVSDSRECHRNGRCSPPPPGEATIQPHDPGASACCRTEGRCGPPQPSDTRARNTSAMR